MHWSKGIAGAPGQFPSIFLGGNLISPRSFTSPGAICRFLKTIPSTRLDKKPLTSYFKPGTSPSMRNRPWASTVNRPLIQPNSRLDRSR